MIQRSYLALLAFSVLFCMVLWLGGSYRAAPDVALFAMFYGIVLPAAWAILTYGKQLLCAGLGAPQVVGRVQVCPVAVAPVEGTLATALLSYSASVVSVFLLAFLAGITVEVGRLQVAGLSAVLPALFVLLMQVPVGTMEEGVFRQAIPEFLALIGGHPLFYALLSSTLFGLLHLWAYGNVFLTVSATVVGFVNSLIYYGYLGRGAGNLTGIALGHTLYNFTVVLLPVGAVVSIVLPMAVLVVVAFALARGGVAFGR